MRALEAHAVKRANVEGSAAFAVFAPRRGLSAVVGAQVAFQSIYDYVDTLAEQHSACPIVNARHLHHALLAALDHGPQPDYYACHPHADDGGYLETSVHACRRCLRALPSYPHMLQVACRMTRRIVNYQSLNLTEPQGGQDALARWAASATPDGTCLRWWETAASAGSSLGMFALISAAGGERFTLAEANAIERVYWPWVGALHSLLDSVSDEAEDAAASQRSLLDYYSSPQEAAGRLRMLTVEAVRHMDALPNANQHLVILAGMTGSYLSRPPATERGRLIRRAVLETVGGLVKPTIVIFRAREAIGRLGRGESAGAVGRGMGRRGATDPRRRDRSSGLRAGVGYADDRKESNIR
jgi:tetraprenyl-beta-curcumene synthase